MPESPPAATEERPEILHAPATALAIGLLAGIGSALLGIGGGLIMVPAMAFLLHIRQHRATGTSLAVILPAAAAAVYQYGIHGREFPVVVCLSIGGVVGATLGAIIAALLNARQLRQVFGLFVMLTGVVMLLPRFGPAAAAVETLDTGTALLLIGTGVLVGIVSGLLGVGGGLVMVPVLVLLLGFSQKEAQGMSLAVIIPVSLSGVIAHYRRGNVIPGLAVWLSMGAVVGATVMGHYVQKIENTTLRTLFGVFLILVGLSMTRNRPARPQAQKTE